MGSGTVPLVELDATSLGEPAVQLPVDPENSMVLNLPKSVEGSVDKGDVSDSVPRLGAISGGRARDWLQVEHFYR